MYIFYHIFFFLTLMHQITNLNEWLLSYLTISYSIVVFLNINYDFI